MIWLPGIYSYVHRVCYLSFEWFVCSSGHRSGRRQWLDVLVYRRCNQTGNVKRHLFKRYRWSWRRQVEYDEIIIIMIKLIFELLVLFELRIFCDSLLEFLIPPRYFFLVVCSLFVFYNSYASLTQWRMYGEWVFEGNSPPIRDDNIVLAIYSYVFVSLRGRSWCDANIRNMLLKFSRKAYSYCSRNIW